MKEILCFKKAILTFFKWIILSIIVGIIIGSLSSVFLLAIKKATALREAHTNLIYLLPFAGIIIVFLYKLLHYEQGNMDLVIDSTRGKNEVSLKLTPLILISTFLSHLYGASVGKEGAALQLGASLGNTIGKVFKLSKEDKTIITTSGMSAGFSVMFGTPIAATIFPMAFPTIGFLNLSALIPCLFSSIIANQISLKMGVVDTTYLICNVPQITVFSILKVIILAICCAILSIIFSNGMHMGGKIVKKYIPNSYLRIFIGGTIIVLLTVILRNTSYLGGGDKLISEALNGNSKPWDFVLKLIFTVISVIAGYKGGEIIPSMAIGASFGCIASSVCGLPVDFCTACALLAVFCGVTNSPITSLFLGIELFGSQAIVFFFIAIAVSYLMSGYDGLYRHQNFGFSKYEMNKIYDLNNKNKIEVK